MKYYFFLCVIFSIFLISCKKKDINTFEIIVQLKDYDTIFSDKNDLLGSITDIEINDSIIISKHMHGNFYFSFLNINTGRIIERWVNKGRGPDEINRMGSGFFISNNKLVFLDDVRKEVNEIPLNLILSNRKSGESITKKTYPYTIDFRPRSLCFVGENKIFIGSFKQGRFGLIDYNDSIVSCPFDYPFDTENVEGIYRGSVFQSKVKSCHKNSKFVIQTLCSDVFEIYSINDTSLSKTFISPFKNIPKILKSKGMNSFNINFYKSIAGLLHMSITEEMICFTYSSDSYMNARKTDFMSDEIICFNWNGDKLKKYKFPFPIAKFCIDDKFIYTVHYHRNETIFLRFKL
jgi:hypothetical protein